MAVEIRELVIKAVIVDDKDRDQSRGSQSLSDAEQNEIIQQCVNQVLKIIKKSNNR